MCHELSFFRHRPTPLDSAVVRLAPVTIGAPADELTLEDQAYGKASHEAFKKGEVLTFDQWQENKGKPQHASAIVSAGFLYKTALLTAQRVRGEASIELVHLSFNKDDFYA